MCTAALRTAPSLSGGGYAPGRAALDVVALTDHDTTAGWAAATDAVPTVVSRSPWCPAWNCPAGQTGRGPISLHLLAYLFDPDDPQLAAETRRIRGDQVARPRHGGSPGRPRRAYHLG